MMSEDATISEWFCPVTTDYLNLMRHSGASKLSASWSSLELNLMGSLDRCSNDHSWLNIPDIRLSRQNWWLVLCLLVKIIVLNHTQSLIVGIWRAVGQDTDLQSPVCQSGCNPGRREGSGGLTLMSLSPRAAEPAVPGTPLSHSLIHPATVNNQKNTEQTGSHNPIAYWYLLFSRPVSGFWEIACFGREKQQVEVVKVHPPVTACVTKQVTCLFSFCQHRRTEGCVFQQERPFQICGPSPFSHSSIFH